ncbi:uncharacterized protein METZ01_LOCUS306090, partial [marine metagenome]
MTNAIPSSPALTADEITYEIRHGRDAQNPQVFARINGELKHLPALWLRERAQSNDQINEINRQRLFNPHQLPLVLKLIKVKWCGDDQKQLMILFSDGYEGAYNIEKLNHDLLPTQPLPIRKLWKSDLSYIPTYSWLELKDPHVTLAAVMDYLQFGFLIVSDTPLEKDSILKVGRHFGFIYSTNFGDYFEISSRPNSNDLAYSSVALTPHTDNPYREPAPGIQLLQCLLNETMGGLSTLVDSMACAEVLKQETPDGFKLLAEIPVKFEFNDAEESLSMLRPILALDAKGDMLGLHYSPRLDKLPLLEEQILQNYHHARNILAQLLLDPTFQITLRLKPGQCILFDNCRVLHGRTSFD